MSDNEQLKGSKKMQVHYWFSKSPPSFPCSPTLHKIQWSHFWSFQTFQTKSARLDRPRRSTKDSSCVITTSWKLRCWLLVSMILQHAQKWQLINEMLIWRKKKKEKHHVSSISWENRHRIKTQRRKKTHMWFHSLHANIQILRYF